VLLEAAYTWAEIAELRDAGAFGAIPAAAT
jgi:hypothetical protein